MKRVWCIEGLSELERFEVLKSGIRRKGYELVASGRHLSRLHETLSGEFDFAICSGMRQHTARARALCQERGIPVMIIELGYMNRANSNADSGGYFQLGWDQLCWVPLQAPSDRFDKLGLEVLPSRQGGSYILVASQVGGDAQHGMTALTLDKWLANKAMELHRKVKKPIVWRQHPAVAHARPRVSITYKQQNPKIVKLGAALAEASHVVTYNSTLGVEALRLGVPIVCSSKAHYSDCANGDVETRKSYLSRLAYAQWLLPEIESGEAVEYLLGELK